MIGALTNDELGLKLLEPDVSRETLREVVRRITGRVEPLPEAVQTALPGIGSESPLVALQDVPHATLARGESNADSDWHEAAVSSVSAYAQMGVRFTAADILKRCDQSGYETHDRRALGNILMRFARIGVIVRTGEMRNTGSHGRPQVEWISA